MTITITTNPYVTPPDTVSASRALAVALDELDAHLHSNLPLQFEIQTTLYGVITVEIES